MKPFQGTTSEPARSALRPKRTGHDRRGMRIRDASLMRQHTIIAGHLMAV